MQAESKRAVCNAKRCGVDSFGVFVEGEKVLRPVCLFIYMFVDESWPNIFMIRPPATADPSNGYAGVEGGWGLSITGSPQIII